MNKTDDMAMEMANMMAEMAAEWAADDAERARKYKIATVFLAERMLDDLKLVKEKLHLREAVGSYVIHQRKTADASLATRIADTERLITFLKEADQEYFIKVEDDGKDNEAVRLLKMFAEYFRGDCNNLKLAKISNDIENFRLANIDESKSDADAIVVSLEGSIRDIFKE